MDILEELAADIYMHLHQEAAELDSCLELLCRLGISIDLLHDGLVEHFEHYRHHEDTCRPCFLDVGCNVLETLADGDSRSAVHLA